eukprot:maker-scaffold660_size117387-snap-gene-0.23 protein:Tk06666 transcript:maker-scaffold660_size117387-snap-gene-0.23-mRNA-1 annotation:"carbohydrate sulfotransferase 11"
MNNFLPRRANAQNKVIFVLIASGLFILVLWWCKSDPDALVLPSPPRINSLEDYHSLLDARKRVIDVICQRDETKPIGLQSNTFDQIHYHVVGFKGIKYMWCPASISPADTNWVHNFMILMGLDKNDIEDADSIYGVQNPVNLVRLWAPELTKKDFEAAKSDPEWVKFIIVQHPFLRLVAYFKRNLETFHQETYYNTGLEIVAKYRAQAKERFSDFATGCDDFKTPVELPHFWEFIQDTIHRGEMSLFDMPKELRPISRLCDICALDYQYIVKAETIEMEEPYLYEVMGFPQEYTGYSKRIPYAHDHLVAEANRFLTMLSAAEVTKLSWLYVHDFAIFEYGMR